MHNITLRLNIRFSSYMQMGEGVFNCVDNRVNGLKARGSETITLLPAPLFGESEDYFNSSSINSDAVV
jgi:hypothetical protein